MKMSIQTPDVIPEPKKYRVVLTKIDDRVDRRSMFSLISKVLRKEIRWFDDTGNCIEAVELFVATKDIAETSAERIIRNVLHNADFQGVKGIVPTKFFELQIEPDE